MKSLCICLCLISSIFLFQSCSGQRVYQTSLVDYLQTETPFYLCPPCVCLPMRVGIAFVPEKQSMDKRDGSFMLRTDTKKMLLEQVRDELAAYDYICSIKIIPSGYLKPHGGFENLSCVGFLFNVDAILLVSFDQCTHIC